MHNHNNNQRMSTCLRAFSIRACFIREYRMLQPFTARALSLLKVSLLTFA